MMQKVLILEDFNETRAWLKQIVDKAFLAPKVFDAASVQQAKRLLQEQEFDLALIDLNLPDGNGAELIKMISSSSPATYCVVATVFDDDEHLFTALKAGAQGYLLKNQTDEEFIQSLQGIIQNQPPISPVIARKLIGHFHEQQADYGDLTEREVEILSLIAKGYTRKEVSSYLSISCNTVASHIASIYGKLNISSRSEATLEALRLGLINN